MLSALFRPLNGVRWLLWGRWLLVGAGVGASRGVPAFKHARGQPPGGPKNRPRLHKKRTSLLDKQVDQPLTKQWFCEQSTAFQDSQGRQQTRLRTPGPDNLDPKDYSPGRKTHPPLPTLQFFVFQAVWKTAVISFVFNKSDQKAVSRCSTWIASSPHHTSCWWDEKCVKNCSQLVLLFPDFVTPRQGQGKWNQYKKVAVTGAYKHKRYEQKFLPHKMSSWQAGQKQLITQIQMILIWIF